MKSDLKLPLSMVFDHESEKKISPKEDDQFFCEYCDVLSFQKNCSKIQSIIDCFQIEIQKPSDPVQQYLHERSIKDATR